MPTIDSDELNDFIYEMYSVATKIHDEKAKRIIRTVKAKVDELAAEKKTDKAGRKHANKRTGKTPE